MEHPLQSSIDHTTAGLRTHLVNGSLAADEHISQGVYFSWDADASDVSIALEKSNGAIFDSSITVSTTPQWLTFNIGLGEGVFAEGDVLTVILDHHANSDVTFETFIRTSNDSGYFDTHLSETAKVSKDRTTTTTMHWIKYTDSACGISGYQTLIVPLPLHNFHWRLNNIRILASPARYDG